MKDVKCLLFKVEELGESHLEVNRYQQLASRTINNNLFVSEMEQHALYGMAGEVGELHSLYQKEFQGHEFDDEHAMKEVGDLLWFIAEYCTAKGWDLEDVMLMNLMKLRSRYPKGFSEENSLHRDDMDI